MEWVAISVSRRSSQPRDKICISCIGSGFLTTEWDNSSTLCSNNNSNNNNDDRKYLDTLCLFQLCLFCHKNITIEPMFILEKEMATHFIILARRIPETEEPGGLPSMGSQSQTRLKQLSSSSGSMSILVGYFIFTQCTLSNLMKIFSSEVFNLQWFTSHELVFVLSNKPPPEPWHW